MIYLADGETEVAIISALKKNGTIKGGMVQRIRISNTTNKRFSSTLDVRLKRKSHEIAIITDSDSLCEVSRLNNLRSNINYLKSNKYVKRIYLILQYNLEHELCSALEINANDLYKLFGVQGNTEFKSNLINISSDSLLSKLKNIHKTTFWSSSHHKVTDPKIIVIVSPYLNSIFRT